MTAIYLDHAASTPMDVESVEVFHRSLKEDYSNSAAAHVLGREQNKKIEKVRNLLRQNLKALEQDYQVVFTSSATESNNWVLEHFSKNVDRGTVMSSKSYHPSLIEPVVKLETDYNWDYRELRFSGGRLDEDHLLSEINSDTKLLNLLWVNNSIGMITDVEKLSCRVKSKFPNIHIHVDGVQGFAKFPLSLQGSQIDSLTVNGHKMGGPKGVSALIFRKSTNLKPWLLGGNHEFGFRSSTVNGPAIIAWGEAIKNSYTQMTQRGLKVRERACLFKDSLKEKCPQVEFPFLSENPYIVSAVFPGVSSDVLLRHVERRGVILSSSSACSSRGEEKISPVYGALGLDEKQHGEILRVSLSHVLEEEEITLAVEIISQEYLDLCQLLK